MSIGSWFARKIASAAPTRKDSVPDTTPLATKPNTHFERYRTLIDSFDEDRETVLRKDIAVGVAPPGVCVAADRGVCNGKGNRRCLRWQVRHQ